MQSRTLFCLYHSNLVGLQLTIQVEAAVNCRRNLEDLLLQASDQPREECSTWRMNVQCVSDGFEGMCL